MAIRYSRFTLLAASVAAVLGAARASAAEPSGPQASELGEIVVTARQREERITDVPVTVQAFTATDIQNAGIERPEDFIALTPGVSQVNTAEIGDIQVNIRGINTGRDTETNFALVIDGVLQTNPAALNQELSGVTQIEVLKGPQGALYGRNAVAGAMILTTRKPGDEFQADVGAGVGSDGLVKGNLWIGGPVGPTRTSLSAYYRDTDGQWSNRRLGCDDCVDYFTEYGATLRSLFDLAGGQMDFKAKWSQAEAGAINFNSVVALSEASTLFGVPPLWQDPNDYTFDYINNIKPQNEQDNINVSLKGDWAVGENTLTAYVAYNDQDNFFLTDGASGAFGLYAATSVCQASLVLNERTTPLPPPYSYGTAAAGRADAFLPAYDPTTCGGYQYQQRDQEDLSFEIRLTSPGDQRVRWIVGAYYGDIERRVVVSQGGDLARGFLAQPFVPTSGPNPTDQLYDDTFTSTVLAGFGQVSVDVVENVEVNLALRYDREEREVDNNVPKVNPQTVGFGGFGFPVCGPSGPNPSCRYYINPFYNVPANAALTSIPSRDKTFSQFQPKLTLNWKITEDFSAFASYGIGFRSGGFNSSGSQATIEAAYGNLCIGSAPFATLPACRPDGSNRNIIAGTVRDDYDKEVSNAAEIGFKSVLADGRLSLNGAIFYTEVEDMLFFNFFAGTFGLLRVVTNIDEVTIQGAELDARWRINDMFTVFAGYSIIDGEIDKYSSRPYTAGNEVPYAPEYTGTAGVDFSMPLGSGGLALVARADASFVGTTWFHPIQEGTVLPNVFTNPFPGFGFGQGSMAKMEREPYTVLNARLGLQGERWGVTAWGRNLADEEYRAEIINAPEFPGAFVHDAPGRSYGLDVNYRF